MTIWDRKKLSFGFVSTRFAGTDGVSLETEKWVDVLRSKGCSVYYMAGLLDTDPEISHLAPKAFFQHEDILEIQHALFAEKRRTPEISRRVDELKAHLKAEIEAFHRQFNFEILVVQNVLALPVNIPLSLALAEFIIESEIPTIAHHHDFYWERQRYYSFAAMDYLRWAFPPLYPTVQHVVINSLAGQELGRRTGEPWVLVPNVLDFKNLPPEIDSYTQDLRAAIGLDEDTTLILQPTRIVPRKGIEAAIELVKRLNLPKSSLVISHEAGDEGYVYQQRIEEYARFLEVDLRIIADRVGDHRGTDSEGKKIYSLWDIYPHADLVTYPSIYEGFGNAFVETIYFKKPIVVNEYSIFEADIEPKGYDVIAFSGFLTDETVDKVKRVLEDPNRLAHMVETNYMLGWRYLSYEALEEKLEQLLINYYGS
jgi:glycosyltransferase involved in cell wall biosynthesis